MGEQVATRRRAGRVAYIDVRDLSEAAALVLRDPALHGKTYELSGGYTFPEIAGLLSRILGHEITYVPVSPDDRRSATVEEFLIENAARFTS